MRLRQTGHTLAELMFAILLLGLIVAVAAPHYVDYQRRSDRQVVASLLQQNATFLERYYSEHGSYKASPIQWPALPYSRYPESGSLLYTLAFGSTPRNTDPDYYVLRATATDTTQGYVELLQTGTLRHCAPLDGKVTCKPL